MSGLKSDRPLITNGRRLDGRAVDELRPITMEVGVLKRADGSCYYEQGDNKVMAAVYGPREVHPRHQEETTRAIVRYRYNMAAFSVDDRKRPGPDRRSVELSKVSRQAIEPLVLIERFPRSAIDVFVEVLQADAGTRTAGINAACLALVDAGIPMRGLVAACAAGKVEDTVVLDLNQAEDNFGQADLPVAMWRGGTTLIQMDGHMTYEEFQRGYGLARKGCEQILERMRKTLLSRHRQMGEGGR